MRALPFASRSEERRFLVHREAARIYFSDERFGGPDDVRRSVNARLARLGEAPLSLTELSLLLSLMVRRHS